jgi:hypothetical protein
MAVIVKNHSILINPLENFCFGLRSKETQRQYPKILNILQVKSALGVFRAYVKRIEDKAVYRNELSLVPNEPVSTAFEILRKKFKIDKDSFTL